VENSIKDFEKTIKMISDMFNKENINRILVLEDKEYEIVYKRSSVQMLEGLTKQNRVSFFQSIYSQILIGQLMVTDTSNLIYAGVKNKHPRMTLAKLTDLIPIDPKEELEIIKQAMSVYLYDTKLITTMERQLEEFKKNMEKDKDEDEDEQEEGLD